MNNGAQSTRQHFEPSATAVQFPLASFFLPDQTSLPFERIANSGAKSNGQISWGSSQSGFVLQGIQPDARIIACRSNDSSWID